MTPWQQARATLEPELPKDLSRALDMLDVASPTEEPISLVAWLFQCHRAGGLNEHELNAILGSYRRTLTYVTNLRKRRRRHA